MSRSPASIHASNHDSIVMAKKKNSKTKQITQNNSHSFPDVNIDKYTELFRLLIQIDRKTGEVS